MTGTVITHIEWRAASADELTGRRYIARTRLGTVVDGVFAADVHADRYEQTLADRDIEALPVLRFRRFLPPTLLEPFTSLIVLRETIHPTERKPL